MVCVSLCILLSHLSQSPDRWQSIVDYRKVPKFSDARKLCCNLPKIQTKRPNLRVFRHKDANGIAKSENPDQTASLKGISLPSTE